MNWDQIETKWAAMTRRIRSDWPRDQFDTTATSIRRVQRADAPMATIADRQTMMGDDRSPKISAK